MALKPAACWWVSKAQILQSCQGDPGQPKPPPLPEYAQLLLC